MFFKPPIDDEDERTSWERQRIADIKLLVDHQAFINKFDGCFLVEFDERTCQAFKEIVDIVQDDLITLNLPVEKLLPGFGEDV